MKCPSEVLKHVYIVYLMEWINVRNLKGNYVKSCSWDKKLLTVHTWYINKMSALVLDSEQFVKV